MKKIVLMAAFAVASIAASAQVYVGGSLGFESRNAGEGTKASMAFSIAPEVGYKLSDNLAVGIQLGYSATNDGAAVGEDGENNVESVLKNVESMEGNKPEGAKTYGIFNVAPYVRYTFAQTGAASFFVDGGVYASFLTGGDDSYKGTVFGVGVRPGVKFAASEKVDVVAKLGYLGWKGGNKDAQANGYAKSAFGINANNTNLELGILYNF